jgi:FKBP-type peptidyl-prolyl cis-trans isomerase
MKGKFLVVLAVLTMTAQAGAAKELVLKTQQDKVNYGIGVSVAKNFQQQGMKVDADLVVRGLKDQLEGKKLLLSDEELQKTMMTYQNELRQQQIKESKAAAQDNKKEGEAFLEANKKKQGVVTLPSGLQFKILKAGEGQKPTAEDTVEVNYKGTFINGKEFDSSHGGVAAFKVSGVIKGWREALQLMPVGSKWQLFVPPQLAYGEKGMGRAIMPNTTLLFEVELVGLKPAASEAPPANK